MIKAQLVKNTGLELSLVFLCENSNFDDKMTQKMGKWAKKPSVQNDKFYHDMPSHTSMVCSTSSKILPFLSSVKICEAQTFSANSISAKKWVCQTMQQSHPTLYIWLQFAVALQRSVDENHRPHRSLTFWPLP